MPRAEPAIPETDPPPEFPELPISGHERRYFSYFSKHEAQDPTAIPEDAIDEYVRRYSSPGGLRRMASIYRAPLTDAEQNREAATTPLAMPVLAVAGEPFIGTDNERVVCKVATDGRTLLSSRTATSSPRSAPPTWPRRN